MQKKVIELEHLEESYIKQLEDPNLDKKAAKKIKSKLKAVQNQLEQHRDESNTGLL